MTQAVIFDLDGTLTDTEKVWEAVRRDLAAQDGVEWPDSASRAMTGMSTREWSTYMSTVVGIGASPEDAARRTIDGLRERYDRDLPVLPGAREAVRRLAAHWPLGVASSSPRDLIEHALRALGVRELIAVVRSTEEGTARGKPAPDAFLWVADELGAEPARTVVVEDSGSGIIAGVNAGMRVVAVSRPFLRPPDDILARASVVLHDLDELTVELVRYLGAPSGVSGVHG
ncbi:MAG: HAD family phosphatase [Micropruina sp.]|uniref:HAD family hydrolase n=1 Tax=Micropruina sp. TaxID=2737536 RepID=UPI0039E67B27